MARLEGRGRGIPTPTLATVMARVLVVAAGMAALSSCQSSGNPAAGSGTQRTATEAAGAFLAVSGSGFTYHRQPVTLRGVNFNNEYALRCCNEANAADIDKIAYNGADYARVHRWGGNLVRWGMSYAWYEKDRARFFSVMDKHLAWAKQNHLWMIPVLYEDPSGGGDFSQPNLWGNGGNQEKLNVFWQDIAKHYRDDYNIAGYDVLNEPAPPAPAVWQALAQQLQDSIAQADPNHFLVYEAVENGDLLPLSGGKVVYSAHVYKGVTNYPAVPPGAPLWIGEFGSKDDPGWVKGQIDRFNHDGVHWAYFVMREDPGDYGLYLGIDKAGDFSRPNQRMINVVSAGLRGSVTPG